MKVVYNWLVPFQGYKAMTMWPFIFVRKDCAMREKDFNHECIHAEQQKELFPIGVALAVGLWFVIGWWSLCFLPLFYELYVLEWIVKVFWYGELQIAYHNISFEREAFGNEDYLGYLAKRKRFAWIGRIFGDRSGDSD